MSPWLLSAMQLLRAATIGGPGRALATGAAGATVIGGGLDLPFDIFGEDEKKKRRRRRRALTASDRADIGFIAATLGQPAGKAFALVIASRISR